MIEEQLAEKETSLCKRDRVFIIVCINALERLGYPYGSETGSGYRFWGENVRKGTLGGSLSHFVLLNSCKDGAA